MTEENREGKKDLQPQSPGKTIGDELDAAGKSLSEALRISFAILKVIMIVLVLVFLASGFRTVGSDEQALVLRFGKIRGAGEKRLLGPGLKLLFPFPIHDIVKVPVAKKINLPINSFWYFQTAREKLAQSQKTRIPIPQALNPIKDGYCTIRSEKRSRRSAGSTGSDYNIVHSKWQLTYQIVDPERFFKNVYVEDIKPGESYYDVIIMSITPLLENLFEDAVVTAMVNYTVDEALFLSQDRITRHVQKLSQEKLDDIESGIRAVSVQLIEMKWPRQVDMAFQASITASNMREQAISEAKGYAENTLNETAGPVGLELLAAIEDKTIGEQEKEPLWTRLAGAAQEKIDKAKAYRMGVVETARADAEYLQEILPEYRKYPKLVIQKIYQDAIEYVLNNADEKFIIQPTEGTRGREFRLQLNRDPTIKPKSEK